MSLTAVLTVGAALFALPAAAYRTDTPLDIHGTSTPNFALHRVAAHPCAIDSGEPGPGAAGSGEAASEDAASGEAASGVDACSCEPTPPSMPPPPPPSPPPPSAAAVASAAPAAAAVAATARTAAAVAAATVASTAVAAAAVAAAVWAAAAAATAVAAGAAVAAAVAAAAPPAAPPAELGTVHVVVKLGSYDDIGRYRVGGPITDAAEEALRLTFAAAFPNATVVADLPVPPKRAPSYLRVEVYTNAVVRITGIDAGRYSRVGEGEVSGVAAAVLKHFGEVVPSLPPKIIRDINAAIGPDSQDGRGSSARRSS